MPDINHNGIVREMTAEEVKFFEIQREAPVPPPSDEDRLSALEFAMLAIMDGGMPDV